MTAPISTRGAVITTPSSSCCTVVVTTTLVEAPPSNFLTGAKRVRERAAAMDCASGARMEVGVKEVMEGRLPPATLSVVVEVEVAMEGRL